MQSTSLNIPAFGIENITYTSTEVPEPGPFDVLVDLHTASLNYRDFMTVTGTYNPKMQLPRVPGSDAAGIVVSVGENVTLFKAGDRVTSLFFQDWLDGQIQPGTGKSALGGAIDGAFTTARLFPETGLIHAPAGYSHQEAATLPCAALTAWNALVEKGSLHAGQTVLILGTGGVSLFALQFAKAHGARVILTSSSDEKLARGRELGADETINYKTHPDWEVEVLKLTYSRGPNTGVDHVVEVGGAGTLPRSMKAVTPGGHIFLIGVLSDPGAGVDVRPVLGKSIHLDGVYVGSRAMFERMNDAITTNSIHPIIDRVFPLSQAKEAFAFMQSGSHFGKIVLDLKQ